MLAELVSGLGPLPASQPAGFSFCPPVVHSWVYSPPPGGIHPDISTLGDWVSRSGETRTFSLQQACHRVQIVYQVLYVHHLIQMLTFNTSSAKDQTSNKESKDKEPGLEAAQCTVQSPELTLAHLSSNLDCTSIDLRNDLESPVPEM